MPKNIIITGANGNLGSAVVKKFLDEKYNVIAVDHEKHHLGFAENNPQFTHRTVDLMNEAASDAFVKETLVTHGKIDGGLLLVGGFAMGGIDTTDGTAIKK